jgi:LPXTG-motif cell wall-anchored protein
MKKSVATIAAISAIALAGLSVSTPAYAAVDCGNAYLLINTGDQLLQFNAAGEQIGSPVSLENTSGYGDIALSLDHSAVYGLFNTDPSDGSPDLDKVEVVNPATGAVTSSFTLTGPAAGIGGWVGAAILPDGTMAIGSQFNSKIYKVNVTDGTTTEWVDTISVDANITGNSGDFTRLPDGDEVALMTSSALNGEVILVRIHADGTMTSAGNVPEAWGAGRVANTLMIAGDDIFTLKNSEIPASSTSTIPTTQVSTFGDTWGAAGTQDGETGECTEAAASLANTGVASGALGALALGLAAAGAAGLVIARRKNA